MVQGLPAIKTSCGLFKGVLSTNTLSTSLIRERKVMQRVFWGGFILISMEQFILNLSVVHGILTFIDDFSGYTWVFVLNKKSEFLERFTEFKALVENAFGRKIKYLRYDNGWEYISS